MKTQVYASATKVSSEKSRAEIETILRRYGADEFGYHNRKDSAYVTFVAKERKVLFCLPLPPKDERRFTHAKSGYYEKPRSADNAYKAWDQEVRQRWRALVLAIKAKLEAVNSGITTFENEFMAHIVLPDGSTVGSWLSPQIEVAYRMGHMPQLALPPAPDDVVEAEEVQ